MECPIGHTVDPGDAHCGTCGAAVAPAFPIVDEVICPSGHANPSDARYCGACGASMSPPPEATCPEGHPNPPGQRFCGECGVAMAADGHRDDVTTTTTEPSRRRLMIVMVAILLVVIAAALALRPTGGDADEQAGTPPPTTRRTTTAPETPQERAQRLLEAECQPRFAVLIDVQPSTILPMSSYGETTAYFFDVYAAGTGAHLSDGTWTISHGNEVYSC